MTTIQIENDVAAMLKQLAEQEHILPEQLINRLIINYAQSRQPHAETEGEKVLQLLQNYGLLGCMEGDGNLSEDYKKHLWGNE